MENDLLFLSGNDIPFAPAQITIHQPNIKEIAYIGEENFFTGCELINFSKNNLIEEDKINLENKTDFDILIAILRERNAVMQKNRNCVKLVLELIVPGYQVSFNETSIDLTKENEVHSLTNDNFVDFKKILNQIAAYKKGSAQDYNPSGRLAKDIADKLKKRQLKLAEDKPPQKLDIFARYSSVIAVGLSIDINHVINWTPYQLFDQYERFMLRTAYDINIKAKLAGAKDLKEAEDWMKDIHS